MFKSLNKSILNVRSRSNCMGMNLNVRLLWIEMVVFMRWIAQGFEDHNSQISLGNDIGCNSLQKDLLGSYHEMFWYWYVQSVLFPKAHIKLHWSRTIFDVIDLTLSWNMGSNKCSVGRNPRLSGSCMTLMEFCTSIGLEV